MRVPAMPASSAADLFSFRKDLPFAIGYKMTMTPLAAAVVVCD
jgi:hypothetical protein